MKKIILSLVFAITAIAVQAQEPAVTMTTSLPNGSDVEFYLASLVDNTSVQIDWGNGNLANITIGQYNTTISGTSAGNTIKIYGSGITSLYASYLSLTALNISKATSLTDLTVSNNQLQSLDIASNTNLQYLDCSKNQLETLSVTTNIKLEKIYCFKNKLTTIDITSNADLWELDCSNNLMTTLNFSSVTNDVDIDCSNNLLTSLTLGKNMNSVWCKNNALTSLDVSLNTSLYLLDCSNNQLNSLNLSNNGNLQYLICSYNKLSTLDLSHNPSLTEVYCTNNKLTLATLPIKQTYWNVYSYSPQAIYSLPKKNYETGESINLSSQLSVNGVNTVYTWKTKGGQTLSAGTHYTVTNGVFVFNSVPTDSVFCEITNTNLADITLITNAVLVTAPLPNVVMVTTKTVGSSFTFTITAIANNTTIQVDWGNGTLENYTFETSSTISGTLTGSTIKIYGEGISHLGLINRNLTSLDVTNSTMLSSLNCSTNLLTTLDVSKNTALTYLDCSNNQLNILDISQNIELRTLRCLDNKLSSINVSQNTLLTILHCRYNQLSFLDLSKNTELTQLDCSNNQLVTLDVTKNIALEYLWFNRNKLTTIDLTKNTVLTYLVCNNNLLSTLDVSKCSILSELNCSSNKLTFTTLPVSQANWTTYTYSPQNIINLPQKQYSHTETVDLSSELTVNANTTNYAWKTKGGVTLTAGTDYNVTEGVTTFLKVQTDSVYCEMTNSAFPDLTLSTSAIKVTEPTPNVVMTTTTTIGNAFTFNLCAASNNTPILVDWGNGSLVNYTINTSYSSVVGTLSGNTVKIYGGGITKLYLYSNNLTALDVSGATQLTHLDCHSNQLTSLDVSKNTALVVLECYLNQLTNLDVSENLALQELKCSINQLTSLDVTKNTSLKRLFCDSNQITTLDVSQNTALKDLYCDSNLLTILDVTSNTLLQELLCFSNQLTSLDISKNIALKELWCYSNKLNSLDVSKNTALEFLFCESNQLDNLDLSQNTTLAEVRCHANNLKFSTLPIKETAWTTYIYSPQNVIKLSKKQYGLTETLDLNSELTINSNTTNYTWKTKGGATLVAGTDYNTTNGITTFLKVQTDSVYCQMTNATFPDLTLTTSAIKVTEPIPSVVMTTSTTISSTFSFDIGATANNTAIQIDWGDGTLASYTIGTEKITMSGTLAGSVIKIYGEGINYLYLGDKKITSLDVTKNIALTTLYCGLNLLTTLNVSNNTALSLLDCGSNHLTTLDVSNNTVLTSLYCYFNPFETLNVSKNTMLTTLNCQGNQLTILDLTNNTALTELYCDANLLTVLNVSNNTALTRLYCGSNGLTVLDVSNNTALTELYCRGNQLTVLDVSNNIALTVLDCRGNQLTVLDVSNNIALTGLDCSNNELTVLDVSNNTALTGLYCDNNQLTVLDVSINTALTYLRCESNQLSFSNLPTKQPTWTTYTYSPQNKVNLAKKQYALTETVDLSSELTVNGNTTNYTWKTKGGATLVAGTDYNFTGGVTTFLKVQSDSVYCQMTNATFPSLTLNTTNIKVSEYPLSVGDNEVAIKVYPNPATENFTIKMAEEIVRVEVYTLTGVKVFENGLYSSTTVNVPLTNMPKGTLLIKSYTRTGVYSGKVVKI